MTNRTKVNYRKVYERGFGVKIEPGNVIHHIDGDSHNNSLINLVSVSVKRHEELHTEMGDERLGGWVGYSTKGWKASVIARKLNGSKNSLKGADRTDAQLAADAIRAIDAGRNSATLHHDIYHFIHKDGDERKCTKWALRQEFGMSSTNLAKMVAGRKNFKSCFGWRLF